jgi:hypothetical protein
VAREFDGLPQNTTGLLILRNHLTRRAKQAHDAIIAAPGTEQSPGEYRAISHANSAIDVSQSTQAGAIHGSRSP